MKLLRCFFYLCTLCFSTYAFSEEAAEAPVTEEVAVEAPAMEEEVIETAEETVEEVAVEAAESS